jgi:hypothetical protein
VQSFFPGQLWPAVMVERRDGSGDVVLGTIEVPGGSYGPQKRLVGFFAIADPREAFELIKGLSAGVSKTPQLVEAEEFSLSQLGLPGFLIVVACLVSWSGVTELIKAEQSESWPATTGLILDSHIQVRYGRGVTHTPAITYEYQVGGETLISKSILFGDTLGDERHASRIVDRFPRGASVTVHYDPSNPASSVLEPGVFPIAWFRPSFGIFVLIMAISAASTKLLNNRKEPSRAFS